MRRARPPEPAIVIRIADIPTLCDETFVHRLDRFAMLTTMRSYRSVAMRRINEGCHLLARRLPCASEMPCCAPLLPESSDTQGSRNAFAY